MKFHPTILKSFCINKVDRAPDSISLTLTTLQESQLKPCWLIASRSFMKTFSKGETECLQFTIKLLFLLICFSYCLFRNCFLLIKHIFPYPTLCFYYLYILLRLFSIVKDKSKKERERKRKRARSKSKKEKEKQIKNKFYPTFLSIDIYKHVI